MVARASADPCAPSVVSRVHQHPLALDRTGQVDVEVDVDERPRAPVQFGGDAAGRVADQGDPLQPGQRLAGDQPRPRAGPDDARARRAQRPGQRLPVDGCAVREVRTDAREAVRWRPAAGSGVGELAPCRASRTSQTRPCRQVRHRADSVASTSTAVRADRTIRASTSTSATGTGPTNSTASRMACRSLRPVPRLRQPLGGADQQRAGRPAVLQARRPTDRPCAGSAE